VRTIVFDSGPLISLTMSNLLWILEPLKSHFGGRFVITPRVEEEIIKHPLTTNRFRFEAIQIQEKVSEGTLQVVQGPKIQALANELLAFANEVFSANGHPVQIVSMGEIQSLAMAIQSNADAFVVDERITRYLIEDPHAIREILERRLHRRVEFDDEKMHAFHERVSSVGVLRSTELAARAIELGLLDRFLSKKIPHTAQMLTSGVLWQLKLSGCAITERDIDAYPKLLKM